MKKIFLCLALAGMMGFLVSTPALACEGGKCKMEHKESDKNSKSKKNKKAAAKAESCHATTSGTTAATLTGETKSCCMKKEKAKTAAPAETKNL